MLKYFRLKALKFFRLQFGNIRAPNGEVFSIDWTDFQLSEIEVYQDQTLQSTTIQIEANGHEFIVEITFDHLERISLIDNTLFIPIKITCNDIDGFGVAVFKNIIDEDEEVREEEEIAEKDSCISSESKQVKVFKAFLIIFFLIFNFRF